MKIEIIKDLGYRITNAGYKRPYVLVRCFCGKVFEAQRGAIKSGNTKSCGCSQYKKDPNSATKQKEYWLLQNIKSRCYNKNREYYYLYGGRGIKICDDWLNDAQLFIDWCRDNGYKKGLQIDRIDVNGDYEPNNCRFVEPHINAQNTRLLRKNNTSGFRGVRKLKYKNKIKWRATISISGKQINLGVYDYKIDAAKAYNKFVIDSKTEHPLNPV